MNQLARTFTGNDVAAQRPKRKSTMTKEELGAELSDIQTVSGVNYQRHHSFFYTEVNLDDQPSYADMLAQHHRLDSLDLATGPPGNEDVLGMYVRYAPISRSLAGLNLEMYHSKAQLGGRREGLLVDLGAHSNLSGGQWIQRVTDLAHAD